MLKYVRVDISERIDVNKTDRSKECKFCHYWYFLNKSLSYGPFTCDGCYDVVQRSTDRIYFQNMNKHQAKKKK